VVVIVIRYSERRKKGSCQFMSSLYSLRQVKLLHVISSCLVIARSPACTIEYRGGSRGGSKGSMEPPFFVVRETNHSPCS